MKPRVTRYHPLLVALHWLVAILIIGNLAGASCCSTGCPMGTRRSSRCCGCTCWRAS